MKKVKPIQGSLLQPGMVLPVPQCYFPHLSVSVMAGIDEAGRGCLAGPVVAGAVLLPAGMSIPGLDDSKVLSASRRDGLAAQIGTVALAWSLGVVWPAEIDRINILQATFKAMSRAAATLKVRPAALLVDGNHAIPDQVLRAVFKGAVPKQRAIVDGDALVPVISAASIVAKTFRDNLMDKLDARYPGYGFAKHKGYGTKEHLEALIRLGPCRMHRMTFRGVLPPGSISSVDVVSDNLNKAGGASGSAGASDQGWLL